nr:hypothetical protein [Megavirus caiporensis]
MSIYNYIPILSYCNISDKYYYEYCQNVNNVYSAYTGNIVSRGLPSKDTICDAEINHPDYGKYYHHVIYSCANGTYLAYV